MLSRRIADGRRFGIVSTMVLAAVAAPASRSARAAGKAVDGVVNLNTAAPELLSALPGIGPAKAVGIVRYRSRHPFRTVDELVRVKGIGHRMVRAIRAHLAVAGPSTAHASSPGTSTPVIAPAPVVARAPPAAPSCRPAPPPPLPAAIARALRAAQNRSIRVEANHCLPPA